MLLWRVGEGREGADRIGDDRVGQDKGWQSSGGRQKGWRRIRLELKERKRELGQLGWKVGREVSAFGSVCA